VQPLTDRHKPTDNAIFGKAVWLSLRKIKRAAKPPTSRPTFAAHFILPNRTSATRQFSAQPTIFFPYICPVKKVLTLIFSFYIVGFGLLCRAATRTTVNIRVPTNQHLQQPTIQTTTATPKLLTFLYVCLLRTIF
jgi:hypothetical protein